MNKIIWILLVGLLGFIGCSDGDDGTGTFQGQAYPVAPSEIITDTNTPTYEWTHVPGATHYRLFVLDVTDYWPNSCATELCVIHDEWYTAEEAGCAAEEFTCIVTPECEVNHLHRWKVMASANDQNGSWSEWMDFEHELVVGIAPPRFLVLDDGIVLDTSGTQLRMWTQDGNKFGQLNWQDAYKACVNLEMAGYTDWRIPTFREMLALTKLRAGDPDEDPPRPEFPFIRWSPWRYWTDLNGYGVPTCFQCWRAYIYTPDGNSKWEEACKRSSCARSVKQIWNFSKVRVWCVRTAEWDDIT